MERRIILFGGTFDPIHYGHTRVAEFACRYLKAQKVIFIPARRSPLKKVFPIAAAGFRLDMIRLAIKGHPKFDVSSIEIGQDGASFTIKTVRSFQRHLGPDVRLFWLVGADVVRELDKWRRVGALVDMCGLCVMHRAGVDEPDFKGLEDTLGYQRVQKLRENVIQTPSIDISSSRIRQYIREGRSVRGMVAPAVLEYIRSNSLYQGLKG